MPHVIHSRPVSDQRQMGVNHTIFYQGFILLLRARAKQSVSVSHNRNHDVVLDGILLYQIQPEQTMQDIKVK